MTANYVRRYVKRYPWLHKLLSGIYHLFRHPAPFPSHYVSVDSSFINHEAANFRESWMADSIPSKQRRLVDNQLLDFAEGRSVPVFDSLIELLQPLAAFQGSLLEVGCSSAYYSEVLKARGFQLNYHGCDYSPSFIRLGQQYYPDLPLYVEDATALAFDHEAFDIVISGCCLLHILDFEKAIAEAARVARQYVAFHRTPVCLGLPNQYYRKIAYDVETIEIHFNEPDLLALFSRYDLHPIGVVTLQRVPDPVVRNAWHIQRSYLCRKVRNDD
jgi:SAM-dependent methyltransferase